MKITKGTTETFAWGSDGVVIEWDLNQTDGEGSC